MANRDGTNGTLKKRADLLVALRGGQSISDACKASSVARRTAYNWRDADTDFAAEWDDALDEGTDALEDEAKRRAVDGVEEPVFYQGKQVAKVRKYSDTLRIFLLKAGPVELHSLLVAFVTNDDHWRFSAERLN